MYLITYDIADSKRLRKVSKLLKDSGLRAQNSTFELDIDTSVMLEIQSKILEIINIEQDKVFFYKISKKKKKNRRRGKRKNLWEMIF